MSVPHSLETIRAIAADEPGLTLLILFGSRARGDGGARSDWDLGYLGEVDHDRLLLLLTQALGTDRIDLVALEHASGLLRYRAARDGTPLFERMEGTFDRFWLETVRFWCDAYPIIQAGYADVLAELGP